MAVNVKTDEEYQRELRDSGAAAQYIPSENVDAARERLGEVAAGKPSDYENANADQLGGLYQQILNRDPYSYDPMQDRAYLQYRDQYQRLSGEGAQAAEENTRQMSGGYGDTWSTGAASQIYGEQMKGINDALPAFEQSAYAGYQAESDRLGSQLQTAVTQDNSDYDRWKASYDNWANDRNFAAGRLDAEAQMDMQQYQDNVNAALTVLGFQREDSQFVRSTAYDWAMEMLQQGIMPIMAVLEQAGISLPDAQALLAKATSGGGGGGGGGGKRRSSSSSSTTPDAPAAPSTHQGIVGLL